jgi:hypothetical protein
MPRLLRYPLVLSVVLASMLLGAPGLATGPDAAQAASLSGAPQTARLGTMPAAPAAVEAASGPGHRFGFSHASVLAQATAGSLLVCKQLTASITTDGVFNFATPPGGPTIPTITIPANTTGPTCVLATESFPPFGTLLPAGAVSVTETVPPEFTLQSVTGGTLAGSTATTTIVAGTTTTLTFLNAPVGTGLTVAQAIALVPRSGQQTACADQIGQTCQAAGGVTGSGSVIGSMRWNLTVTVPPGVAAGTVPVAVFTTTTGLPNEGFLCSPVVAGVATVTCNGATAGNALQGSTVTVVFAPGVVVTGTITGPGGIGAAGAGLFLPPLPPPPPPPLLPPPPMVPPVMPLTAATGPFAGLPPVSTTPPSAPMPSVPVIPEADSLPLLLGGLLALGGLTGYRAWRKRKP